MKPGETGQALVELLLSGTLILASVTGSGLILERAYARLECARRVFEAARSAAQGTRTLDGRWGAVLVTQERDGVRARSRCRTGEERVFIPSLESWESHASR